MNPAEKDLPKAEKIPEPRWTAVHPPPGAGRSGRGLPPPQQQMLPPALPPPMPLQTVSAAQRYAASRSGQPVLSRGARAGASPPPQRPPFDPQMQNYPPQQRPRGASPPTARPDAAAPAGPPAQDQQNGIERPSPNQEGRWPGSFPF